MANDSLYEYHRNGTTVAEEMKIDVMDTFRVPFILVCFLLMAFVYIYIYREVRKQQRLQQMHNVTVRNNQRALLISILNLVSFVICWLPPVVIELWFQFSNPKYVSEYFGNFHWKEVVALVVYFNSICDLLIYAVRLSDIKAMWKRRFCDCCFMCRKSLQRQILKDEIEIIYNNVK